MSERDTHHKLEAEFAALRKKHVERQLYGHLKAAREGERLEGRTRLRAALHLRDLYNAALRVVPGGRDVLEEKVHLEIERTMPPRKGRGAFRFARWTLPASVTELTDDVVRRYQSASEPQKSLGVYLAAAAVLGAYLEEDPLVAQAALLRAAGLWLESPTAPSLDEDRFEAAQELNELLQAMCASVARSVELDHLVHSIRRMPVSWDFRSETLRKARVLSMDLCESPILPEPDIGTNIDEILPFPSIPLIRVPLGYLDGTGEVERTSRDNALETAPDGRWSPHEMRVVQYREVRLGAIPLGGGRFGAALESRGSVGVRLDDPSKTLLPVHGTLHWFDRLSCDQLVRLEDGWHRIRLPYAGRSEEPNEMDVVRDGPGDDYDWEHDPVELPGRTTGYGADYVSWTRCTTDHLVHWLLTDHRLEEESAECPWDLGSLTKSSLEQPPAVDPRHLVQWEDYWSDQSGEALPPALLGYDGCSSAVAIRACLDNGLLEASIRDRAQRLRDEVRNMESAITEARRSRRANLLERWKTKPKAQQGSTE